MGLELLGAEVIRGGVQTRAVVEHLDVLELGD